MLRFIFGFGLMIIGFCLLTNPYPIMHLADTNNYNYLVAENTNETEINMIFDRKYAINYFDSNYNLDECSVYLNLYIDEFKNNETIKELRTLQVNNCFYFVENLSHTMSFVIDENCLTGTNHTILINKTSDLTINKIELEYLGSDYNTKSTMNFIQLFSLLVILLSIIFTLYTLK